MERTEQNFLGKLLFTYVDWDEIEVAFLQFYNVEFPFPSMQKYNGCTVTLQLDGTMEIYNENGIVWGSAFPTDIDEWEEL